MRTTEGPKRVDVIYRRIDDDFLDPLAFSPSSMLGVPGLSSPIKRAMSTLANAVGTGIGDDKAIYSLHAGDRRILPRRKADPEECADLALPRAGGACLCARASAGTRRQGGQWLGRLRHVDRPACERGDRRCSPRKLRADPNNFIAQPTLALSTCPTRSNAAWRRAMSICAPSCFRGSDGVRVVPGGLTRVALKAGSLVVNSSQGGGTKDTWVVDDKDCSATPPHNVSQAQQML